MAIYCNKCGTRHECSVCPVCAGFGLSNLQAPAGVGKSFQQADELRAKFEAWAKSKGSHLTRTLDGDDYWDSWTCAAWVAWQAAHASRDAEVEALQDALFQISVRLKAKREPDMDDMSWHTDMIARAQYLANLEDASMAKESGE